MSVSHWEVRGNIHFKGVTSEEEVDWLHAQVLDEAVRLNQMLEYNNAQLVRSGAAKIVGDADISRQLINTGLNWMVNGHNPSPEKVKISTERTLSTVNDGTQFRVGENIMERIMKTETPDTSTLYVGIANDKEVGAISTWHKVGSRILSGSEMVGLVPYDIYTPGVRLNEEQLSVIATLVDTFMTEITVGHLPHLWLDGKFDELIVPGLAESAAA